MGGGAFEPKTVVGQGIEANCKSRQKAFTLAEVLITLAIIGVVAALTIPVVVAKYQQKMYYTQFMKMYNTLSTAFSMAEAEHGSYDSWGASGSAYNQYFNSYFLPYLKVTKKCEQASDCGISDTLQIKPLNYPDSEMPYAASMFAEHEDGFYSVYMLSDGAILVISPFTDFQKGAEITFDTNGAKGPNVMGRDIFDLEIIERYGKYTLSDEFPSDEMSHEELLELYKGSNDEWNCTMEYPSIGSNCAQRLLLEGKMDY